MRSAYGKLSARTRDRATVDSWLLTRAWRILLLWWWTASKQVYSRRDKLGAIKALQERWSGWNAICKWPRYTLTFMYIWPRPFLDNYFPLFISDNLNTSENVVWGDNVTYALMSTYKHHWRHHLWGTHGESYFADLQTLETRCGINVWMFCIFYWTLMHFSFVKKKIIRAYFPNGFPAYKIDISRNSKKLICLKWKKRPLGREEKAVS